jgi:hypothetical protein
MGASESSKERVNDGWSNATGGFHTLLSIILVISFKLIMMERNGHTARMRG